MNAHTTAAIIAQLLVHGTVLAELTSLLTPDQRGLLRERLIEQSGDLGSIDEYEPDCREFQAQRLAEWISALAPKPSQEP